MKELKQFGIVPIDNSVLATTLSEYHSVKDKISCLQKNGSIIRLKKGLFVSTSYMQNEGYDFSLSVNLNYGNFLWKW